MHVWVNVWGKVTLRRAALLLFAPLFVGCIDDFDDPHGYGPNDSSSTSGTHGPQGATCPDLCEASVSCGGNTEDDCRDQCSQLTEVSRRTGCEDELDDILDCLAGLSNVCSQQDRCSDGALRFSDCVTAYCDRYPSDACGF